MKWTIDPNHPLTPAYHQWVDDCHIYSLVSGRNNCTSMRDVEYKGKKWNIHNHFFWLTRKEAIELYEREGAYFLADDARANPIPYEQEEGHEEGLFFEVEDSTPQWRKDGDPYFAHILPTLNLSPLAEEVFNDLKALHISSLGRRLEADHELHLNTWDAGVYQLNKLLKGDEEWEKFRAKFRQLAKSLEHGVYTFGFLK